MLVVVVVVVVVVMLQVLQGELELEAVDPRVPVGWRGGRLGHGALVPLAVLLQRVQQLLGVGVHEVGPRLPQGVHDVVDEAHLGEEDRGGVELVCAVLTIASSHLISIPSR